MSKIAVVYWTGTGNTFAMAEAILEGAKAQGAEAAIFASSEFQSSMAGEYDAIAFGCPAMGAEVLEESEFQPMWDSCTGSLGGKRIALFGSYGWGDGEWMRSWEEECQSVGINLVCDSVICNGTPDENALSDCRAMGAALVK